MNKFKLKILAVDDRDENLLALRAILNEVETTVDTATSGNEALSMMLDTDYALVLLDVQMPGMDGFEVAELMKVNERTRYIPIIFVTAISKEQHYVFKGYKSGAVDYLYKPIEPEILQNKVNVFLELAHRQNEITIANNRLEHANSELTQYKNDLELLVRDRTIKLEHAKEEAELANRARSKFLNNMSHELRTPLHAMKSFVQIVGRRIKQNEFDKEKVLGFLKKHSDAAKRLEELVNNLIKLAEVSSAHYSYQKQWHDLADVAEDAIRSLKRSRHNLKVTIHINNTSSATRSCFDVDRMFQVFQHLLDNAVNASPEIGSVIIRFTDSEINNSHAIRVDIEDEGPGIPENEREKVFEAFVLGSLSDTGAGGKGLGLALCKEIIEGHEGNIWVNETAGKGCCISFQFPITTEQQQERNYELNS